MPKILKHFMNPDTNPYQFSDMSAAASEDESSFAPSEFEDATQDLDAASREEMLEEDARADEWSPERDPERRKSVDFAQIQAQAILDDAHRRSEELAQQAKLDLEAELELIRQGARQEGFREGYAEGMVSALDAAKAEREAHAIRQQEEVKQFLERASDAREQLIEDTKDELCDLAIAAAEKVIRISLKSSKDVIARIIQGATEKLKRKEWVHVYVAACDVGTKAQVSPELTAALLGIGGNVKIVPMAGDESGTCIIEMPDEIIDASVSTQIGNIRELLSGVQSAEN